MIICCLACGFSGGLVATLAFLARFSVVFTVVLILSSPIIMTFVLDDVFSFFDLDLDFIPSFLLRFP